MQRIFSVSRISFLNILALAAACMVYAQSYAQTAASQEPSTTVLINSQQYQLDSLIRARLQQELISAEGDKQKTRELEQKLREITLADSLQKARQIQWINDLKQHTKGFPVVPFSDTLFFLYTRMGSFDAHERTEALNHRIQKLYNDPFYTPDSLSLTDSENGTDILYKREEVILTVTNLDALWVNSTTQELASGYMKIMNDEILAHKEANSVRNWLRRAGFVLLIIAGLTVLVFLINKFFNKIVPLAYLHREWYNHGLTIGNVKLLTPDRFREAIARISNALRIVVILLMIYFSLPMLFSLFPETKALTDTLLGWILDPIRVIFRNILMYLPKLFTILVIFIVFRYAIRIIRFFVQEIEHGRIVLGGFHADWAQPTFGIVKFLLYAFMLVLIFPYLPGSHSAAFQGVSVFLGVLLSLGSSSAISNMIAGMIITYMRPFRIGDHIRIGEITGNVIEKTILVTRIRTIKNEEITVPNSTVLSSNTVNFSTNTRQEDAGLIIHTTVTMGYDVPWQQLEQVLIAAALRTDRVLKDPKPFVLQTSLDDFYASYQVNAYTREAAMQAEIYSHLHQNIQDCCNEAGIEIMSPHYRAVRAGSPSTIPPPHKTYNHREPSFRVRHDRDDHPET
jgi:small-conductance mechanosensitive channel